MKSNNEVTMQVFNNETFGNVRVKIINDEPWFMGRDVCKALGYVNNRKALMDHVDEEDKKDGVEIRDSIGRVQKGIVINESGLYSLILRSKRDSAKEFKRWITSEILPIIRKTGGYVNNDEMFINTYLPNADEQTKIMFKSSLTAIRELNGKIDTLNGEIKKLDGQVSELGSKVEVMTPKAEYYDDVLQSEGLVSITTIAKDYGKSAL